MRYYRLMQAWTENEKFSFEFNNAHDLNTARDDSQKESIKRQLRERIRKFQGLHRSDWREDKVPAEVCSMGNGSGDQTLIFPS